VYHPFFQQSSPHARRTVHPELHLWHEIHCQAQGVEESHCETSGAGCENLPQDPSSGGASAVPEKPNHRKVPWRPIRTIPINLLPQWVSVPVPSMFTMLLVAQQPSAKQRNVLIVNQDDMQFNLTLHLLFSIDFMEANPDNPR
jgi:hypothetical protein